MSDYSVICRMLSLLSFLTFVEMTSFVCGDDVVVGLCEEQPRDYCTISGDPHFCTWDNLKHHYQAPDTQGYYYIDGQMENDNLVSSAVGLPFDVIGIHQDCWSGAPNDRSCLRQLLIRFYQPDGMNIHSQIRMTTSGPTDVLLERLDGSNSVLEFVDETSNNPVLQFQSIGGIGNYEARRVTKNGKMILRVRADYFQNLVATDTLSYEIYNEDDGQSCNQCPSSDLVVEMQYQMDDPYEATGSSYASFAQIWLNNIPFIGEQNNPGGFGGRAFGLCGTNDDSTDTDVDVRENQVIIGRRRRNLLQTVITYLDPCGMQRWTEINEDAWDKHRRFGDSWAVDNPGFESPEDLSPLPSRDCIKHATFLCTNLWFDDGPGAIGTCRQCENDNLARAIDEPFGSFLEDCIFDTCAAADVAGVDLKGMDLEDANNAHVLDMAIGACATGCTPFTETFECAEQCDELTSENGCSNDDCLENCNNCVTGIDWFDPINTAAGCQCHNNGCDQCIAGWWKVNYDFPCQKCSDNPGCLHCTDFTGCQQCASGYNLVSHPTCGLNSVHTAQVVKFCEPIV